MLQKATGCGLPSRSGQGLVGSWGGVLAGRSAQSCCGVSGSGGRAPFLVGFSKEGRGIPADSRAGSGVARSTRGLGVGCSAGARSRAGKISAAETPAFLERGRHAAQVHDIPGGPLVHGTAAFLLDLSLADAVSGEEVQNLQAREVNGLRVDPGEHGLLGGLDRLVHDPARGPRA